MEILGTIGFGLVAGWAALFVRGWTFRTAVVRLIGLAASLTLIIALPFPAYGIVALLIGAWAHAQFGYHLRRGTGP